jgi:hypothetical protein
VAGRLEGAFALPWPELVDRLRLALSEHDLERPVIGPCVHVPPYGTRSSSIVAVGGDGRVAHYLHAEGAPCVTPYEDVTELVTKKS